MSMMNTKGKVLLTSFISVALLSISNASAATANSVAGGTITFSGSVSDTTCNVTTNNGGDFTVNLMPVTTTNIGKTIGVVSTGATPFTMSISGCEGYSSTSTTAQALQISFSGSNVSDDNKYLKNATGTASGVGIAITSDGSNAVDLNTAIKTGLSTSTSDGTSYDTAPQGNVTLYANYYNYGGASAGTGTVVSSVTYTFSYS